MESHHLTDLEWVVVSTGALALVGQVGVLVHVQAVFAGRQARDASWNTSKVNTEGWGRYTYLLQLQENDSKNSIPPSIPTENKIISFAD